MRKIAHYVGPVDGLSNEARVYRDVEWDEYTVRFYREGVELPGDTRYHTSDKQDALTTAIGYCGTFVQTK